MVITGGANAPSSPSSVSTEDYFDLVKRAAMGDSRPFIEKMLRVRTKQGRLAPFHFKPAQSLYWDKRTENDIILKAAQMGFTTLFQAEFFIDAMVVPGIEILLLAQLDDTAVKLFRATEVFMDSLPEGIRPKLSASTQHSIEFDHSAVESGLKSTITVGSAQSKTFGRGLPTHRLLATEVAFYDDNALNVLAGIIARMPTGISRRIEESTADGQQGYFFENWMKATEGDEGAQTPHFFPWFLDPDYQISFAPQTRWGQHVGQDNLTDHEQYLVSEHLLSNDQIRWRRWKTSDLPDLFKQEFPENADEAFLPIGAAVFELREIDRAALSVRSPVHESDGTLVWAGPQLGRSYEVVIDQASGEQRDPNERPLDFQCITVWDSVTLEQMATYRRREVTARVLAKIAADFAEQYHDALVIPESNLAKFGFMEWLREFGVKSIYVHRRIGKQSHIGYSEGFPTTAATKPIVISNYRDILKVEGGTTIHSSNLIRELRNYRYQRGGRSSRMSAAPGGNDDELITAMIAAMPEVREQAYLYRSGGETITGERTRSISVSI